MKLAISGHFGLRSASARFPHPITASSRRGAESAHTAGLGLLTTQVQCFVLHTPDPQIYSSRVLFVSTQSTSTHRFSSFHRYTFSLQQIWHIFSWLCRCREYILSSVCSRTVADTVDALAILCMLIVGLLAVSHAADSRCSGWQRIYCGCKENVAHVYWQNMQPYVRVDVRFSEVGWYPK